MITNQQIAIALCEVCPPMGYAFPAPTLARLNRQHAALVAHFGFTDDEAAIALVRGLDQ